jgi:hypothetical protein
VDAVFPAFVRCRQFKRLAVPLVRTTLVTEKQVRKTRQRKTENGPANPRHAYEDCDGVLQRKSHSRYFYDISTAASDEIYTAATRVKHATAIPLGAC